MTGRENLRVGNPGNKGGTGRPPDWLKEKCKKIVRDKKLVEFLGRVASGAHVEESDWYDLAGKKVGTKKESASTKDRLKAVEMLLDRGYGKAVQPVGDHDDGLADLGKILRERYGV